MNVLPKLDRYKDITAKLADPRSLMKRKRKTDRLRQSFLLGLRLYSLPETWFARNV